MPTQRPHEDITAEAWAHSANLSPDDFEQEGSEPDDTLETPVGGKGRREKAGAKRIPRSGGQA